MKTRCDWVKPGSFCTDYHDREWGVPVHDDRLLFEFLILEGFQAGLSWEIILKRRDGFRRAFLNFDPDQIARFDQRDQQRLLADPGIIRNRLKVASAIDNARAFLNIQAEFGGFDPFIWRFVDGAPIQNAWKRLAEIPAATPESELMSRELKQRGFRFVGATICYAFMQAVGMVNDHTTDCFRYAEIASLP